MTLWQEVELFYTAVVLLFMGLTVWFGYSLLKIKPKENLSMFLKLQRWWAKQKLAGALLAYQRMEQQYADINQRWMYDTPTYAKKRLNNAIRRCNELDPDNKMAEVK